MELATSARHIASGMSTTDITNLVSYFNRVDEQANPRKARLDELVLDGGKRCGRCVCACIVCACVG